MKQSYQPDFEGKHLLKMLANRKQARTDVASFKKDFSYRQAKRLIQQSQKYNLDSSLFGRPSVASWQEISLGSPYPSSCDWVEEFGWLCHSFNEWAPKLNAFIAQRREFGSNYLLGYYDRAKQCLDQIFKEHGFSFWLAERRFMLFEAESGFEKHKSYLSEIQEHTNDPMGLFVTEVLSKRIEPHMTSQAFSLGMANTLDELREDGHSDGASIIEAFCSPWTYGWIPQSHLILWFAGGFTLVDRYNIAMKVLSWQSFPSLSKTAHGLVGAMLDDLAVNVHDSQITHLQWALLETKAAEFDQLTKDYLDAYDLFVTGDYTKSALASEKVLLKDPSSFEAYWLLARNMAVLRSGPPNSIIETSIAARILNLLRQVAENRIDLNVPLVVLTNEAHRLGDNHLGISLWQFCEREGTGSANYQACRYAEIKSKIHSPETLLDAKTELEKGCIAHLIEDYPNHLSLAVHLYRFGGSGAPQLLPTEINPVLESVLKAENAMKRQQYDEVIKWLSPIFNGSIGTKEERDFYTVSAAPLEFCALLETDEAEKAASVTVRNYLANANFLRHVPFERIVEGVREGKWPHLRKSIFLPILTLLNEGDPQDIYEAVDDFLIAGGLSDPRGLLSGSNEFPPDAFRILLRDVLVNPVLNRGALWSKTPDEQRQLRTQILQTLYACSVEDQRFVVNELSVIEQAKILEEAYRDVEGPKFLLDFAELNQGLANLLQSLFDRYIAYRGYEERGGQLATESDLLKQVKAGSVSKSAAAGSHTSEVLLSNFATFVFVQYLFDPERGINATLSTRIRHGSLENQFKRVFGLHSLLATKGLDGKYQCDSKVFESIEMCPPEKRKPLLNAYFTFTDEVNGHFEGLMKILKVRVPPSLYSLIEDQGISVRETIVDCGLLDLSHLFSNDVLVRLKEIRATSISGLLTEIQKEFVSCVETSFTSIRQFLRVSFLREIENAIARLDSAIVGNLDDGRERVQLRKEILAAKTEFIHDLRIIENWFAPTAKLSHTSRTVRDLVATAARVVGFASNGRLGRLAEGNVVDESLTPEESLALYEVVSTLMRNVVQHSGVISGQVVTYDFARESSGRRLLSLYNRMSEPLACWTAVQEATEKIARPADPRALDRSPGGTGLARTRALLSQISKMPVEVKASSDQGGNRFSVTIYF